LAACPKRAGPRQGTSRPPARVVVTDKRRHFLAALRYGIRVETPAEYLAR
jgi:hypothetical protein